MQLVEFDFQVAFFGHFQRVAHRFGDFAEARLHFLGRTQIKLLRLVVHPLGVAEHGLRADADQAIVGVGMGLFDVMDIIGRDQLEAEFLRPGDEMAIDLAPARGCRDFGVRGKNCPRRAFA